MRSFRNVEIVLVKCEQVIKNDETFLRISFFVIDYLIYSRPICHISILKQNKSTNSFFQDNSKKLIRQQENTNS